MIFTWIYERIADLTCESVSESAFHFGYDLLAKLYGLIIDFVDVSLIFAYEYLYKSVFDLRKFKHKSLLHFENEFINESMFGHL